MGIQAKMAILGDRMVIMPWKNGVGILFQWLINDSCYFTEKKKMTAFISSVFYISVQIWQNDLEFMAHFEKKMLQTICRSIKMIPSGT